MSILTPGTGMPKTFLFFWSAVRPSSTPPATPIAPVTAGIATCVIVSRTELFSSLPPLLDAACAASAALLFAPSALLFAPSAVLRALLERLRDERLAALADLLDPLPERLDPLPERLDPLPERLDPLRARLDAPPERLAPLLDPLDPSADVRPRDELRLEDLRELVAAILLTSDTRNTTPAVPVLSQLQAGDAFGLPVGREFRSWLDGCSRPETHALHR
jgi:hypothetical protein